MSHDNILTYSCELDVISRFALDYPDIETGGDLFGFWTHTGKPVVQYVIGPGLNARRTVGFFNQDVDYLNSCGKRLRAMHGLQHIGEWHSHHRLGLRHPSPHDSDTVCRAIKDCGLSRFLLVICTISNECTNLDGFLYTQSRGYNHTPMSWVIFSSSNPLRDSIDKEIAENLILPRTKNARHGEISVGELSEETKEYSELPQDIWIATEAGKTLFCLIFRRLSSEYDETHMKLHSESISISFCKNPNQYEVVFSRESPTPATLFFNNQSKCLTWSAIGWEDINESDLVSFADSLADSIATHLHRN